MCLAPLLGLSGMKNTFRLLAVGSFALALSNLSWANWYNHPVCTTSGVILKWHSTYHDFNGSDFTSSDAPGGMIIPDANLRGITQRAPLFFSNGKAKRGGSFPVWNGPSRTTIRGWINVTVTYSNSAGTTIQSHTWNYTSGSNSNQYSTTSW